MTQRKPPPRQPQRRIPGAGREPQRKALFADLERILIAKDLSWRELASKLGWNSYTSVYHWRDGLSEPIPDDVFAIENALGIPPGTLSRTLGYLPPQLDTGRSSDALFETVVADDPLLSDRDRDLLMGLYHRMTAGPA